MIVVDASVVLEMLLGTPVGVELTQRLLGGAESLCAPHLVDLEVAQVLRRYAVTGELTAARGRQGIQDLRDLPIERYPHELLLERVWELRGHLTAYDAAYVALAEALGAPLLTRDVRLAHARGYRAEVELV